MFELINTSRTLQSAYNVNPVMEFLPFNIMNYNSISGDATPLTNSCLLRKKGYGRTLNHMSGIAKAIERVLYIDAGAKLLGGYAYDDANNAVYAEYWRAEAKHVHGIDVIDPLQTEDRIFMRMDANGLTATHVTTDSKNNTSSKPLTIAVSKVGGKPQGVSAAPLFFLMLVSILNENQFPSVEAQAIRTHYELLKDAFDQCSLSVINGTANYENAVLDERMRVLENDIYAICKYECSSDIQEMLDKLSYSVVRNTVPSVSPAAESDMHGEIRTPSLVTPKGKGAKASSAAKTIVKRVGDYVTSKEFFLNENRILTEEESALVPKLDNLVPDKDIVLKVNLVKASTNFPKPFRNIMWVGETGTGKTTAARIAAQMLHLPYVFVTINPDTILSDLYVNVLPAANKAGGLTKDSMRIIEQSVLDTEGAWYELTGEHDDSVKPGDVIRKVLETAISNDFMYVESPLVKAFRYGWVCEIQEANYAMKPGVLGGLNAALDDIGIIQLPTGEVIRRHPDCVIVATFNPGYEGTRGINQAFGSRFPLKGFMELPDEDDLARRTIMNSNYKDTRTIKKMISVMNAIRRVLADNGDFSGSCSVRELQSWCQTTAIINDPYEAALQTIVPSATNDPEVGKEVVEALETQFAKRI